MHPLRTRMRADLTSAMKARDRVTVAALRSALAAIDNAEAIAVEAQPNLAVSEHIAGGGGATEAARRELTDADVAAVVEREIVERDTAATEYEAAGRVGHAAALRTEADVLRAYL